MTRTLVTVLLIVLLVHCLTLVGFVAYGGATGRFSGERWAQYLATWHGEKLVPPPPEEQIELSEEETPQQAAARIATAEIEAEITNREIQRHTELLRAMQVTINSARKNLEKDVKKLKEEKIAFAAEVVQQNEKARSEGFLKALKGYASMKPKYVKSDFMKMDDEQVVRFLSAMKSDTATSILNQFKTPEEQEKRLRVMKLMEEQKVVSLNPKT